MCEFNIIFLLEYVYWVILNLQNNYELRIHDTKVSLDFIFNYLVKLWNIHALFVSNKI